MPLDTIVKLATLASMAVAASGLLIGVYVYRRQMNAELFLAYTKRYEGVMESFPGASRSHRLRLDGDPPPESEELTAAVLRYLNLCSEESYLCKRGYLARDIWRIREEELRRTLRSPLLRREWARVRREFGAYTEFARYVDDNQRTRAR